MENVSNSQSTNKFLNVFGSLNLSNIKLSGLVKIVVDINNKLFLDNYNGYKIALDVTKPYLPQLAAFLGGAQNSNNINIKIKNAAYRDSQKTHWHVPLYLGHDKLSLPTHFSINTTTNSDITNVEDLHKRTQINYLRDLKTLGLTKIFEEVIDNQKGITPVHFNWGEEKISLRGYDLTNKSNTTSVLSTLEIQSNQNLIENSNNTILNKFSNSNIIVPSFMNIEFEFDSNNINTGYTFNNFIGYFSSAKDITKNNFDDSISTVTLFEYKNKPLEFTQEFDEERIEDKPYQDIISSGDILIPTNSPPQFRAKVVTIQKGDVISVLFSSGENFFDYLVKESDIKNSLLESMNLISKNILKESNNSVVCSFDKQSFIFKMVLSVSENNNIIFKAKTPANWLFVDESATFESINNQDICITKNNSFTNVFLGNSISQLLIGKIKFNITKSFYFGDFLVLRLEYTNGGVFDNNTFFEFVPKRVSLFLNKIGRLIQLKPKPYLGVNTKFSVTEQYDKSEYIKNLKTKYGDVGDIDKQIAIDAAISSFASQSKYVDEKPYIKYELISGSTNKELITSNFVDKAKDNNNTKVLDMCWSDGVNAYITPNVLNLDYRFYIKNANIDYVSGVRDSLRFHWFLIKGETPDYIKSVKDDVRNLRYFTDTPKLTTLLTKSTTTTDYCETVFLGIKYILPQKYNGYKFAVYLDFENVNAPSVKYSSEVDGNNKTIYIVVSKYFDFVDLIRGGDNDNNALIDLSLLYTVNESYNTQSDKSLDFTTGGVLLFDETKFVDLDLDEQVFFDGIPIDGWRHKDVNGNWYVCVKKSRDVITPNFDTIVTEGVNFEFFVYSEVTIDGVVYSYPTMKYTLINPITATQNYVWCDDVIVKFFDTKEFFVNEILPEVSGVKLDDYTDIFSVEKSQLLTQPDEDGTTSGNSFQGQEFITTIYRNGSNHTLRLLNYNYEFSTKKDYFEFEQIVSYDDSGNKTLSTAYFVFPEYPIAGASFNYFNTKFGYDSFDNITSSKITLLNRNQLWLLISDVAKYDIRLKTQTRKQTLSMLNELLVSRLQEYLLINSLVIRDANPTDITTDKFVKILIDDLDTNAVIWRDEKGIPKVTKSQRYSGNYNPSLTELRDELGLQNENSEIRERFPNEIYTIYSSNFNGAGIGATGFWKEVNNIVSSLWCSKTLELKVLTQRNTDNVYNLPEILKRIVTLDECVINGNKNEEIIKQIDANVDYWILNSYVIWLLENVWKLETVTNFESLRVNFFSVDSYNVSMYDTNINEMNFVFTRR